MFKLSCIVCKVKLKRFWSEYQPLGGTAFHTSGHYGSAVTDYMDGTLTSLCVCDPCMSEALSKGYAHTDYSTELKEKKDDQD